VRGVSLFGPREYRTMFGGVEEIGRLHIQQPSQ
jgi:hypothetical protein